MKNGARPKVDEILAAGGLDPRNYPNQVFDSMGCDDPELSAYYTHPRVQADILVARAKAAETLAALTGRYIDPTLATNTKK